MNLATEWSRTLAFAAHQAGVRDVVISPGSRSTPLVWAFAEHAAADGDGFRLHSIVDERAAAFFALGAAKLSGKPALLLCTSGSAPAHYFPAVLEAESCGVPLLILSADRPVSLSKNGAPQTIDQVKLFGDHVRWFFDLDEPKAQADGFRMVHRVMHQGALAAVHPTPGPVHINARFRKPLEPGPAVTDEDKRAEAFGAALRSKSFVAPAPTGQRAADAALDAAATVITKAQRGMLVCGEIPPSALRRHNLRDAARAFATRAGFVVCAETVSQLRAGQDGEGAPFVDSFDAILRSEAGRSVLAADVVIEIGGTPVSTAWQAFLDGHFTGHRIVVQSHGYRDPSSSADQLLIGEPTDVLSRLAQGVPARARTPWQSSVAAAQAKASAAIANTLEAQPFFEGTAVADVVLALPQGSLLSLGNSLPVRLADAWTAGVRKPLTVLSQRGTSGIDGTVAGLAGALTQHDGPAALLLGDVTLLHDLSSLALLRARKSPTLVVVLHNDGGRIFEQLPAATNDAVMPHFDLWTTPHGLSFEHAAAMFGLAYAKVADRPAFGHAVSAALRFPGATVIEVSVPPHGAMAAHRALWATTASALSTP